MQQLRNGACNPGRHHLSRSTASINCIATCRVAAEKSCKGGYMAASHKQKAALGRYEPVSVVHGERLPHVLQAIHVHKKLWQTRPIRSSSATSRKCPAQVLCTLSQSVCCRIGRRWELNTVARRSSTSPSTSIYQRAVRTLHVCQHLYLAVHMHGVAHYASFIKAVCVLCVTRMYIAVCHIRTYDKQDRPDML